MIGRGAGPSRETRQLARVLIAIALAIGAWLRFGGLGHEPLRADELNHYYVAESLRSGADPVLPSGEWYGRGLDYSRLVAVTLHFTDQPELATRIPAAIFGVLAVVIFAIAAWRMAGPWTAVWATMLMVVFPAALEQSRNGRFYTMQLAFGLLAMFAGWMLVRRAGAAVVPDVAARARQWAWATLALLAWVACLRLQVTSLTTVAAWGLAVTAAAAMDLRRWGGRALRASVPLQVVALGLVALAMIPVVRPDLLSWISARALEVPYWARAVASDDLSYARVMLDGVPILGWVAPLAFALLFVRRPRLGAYLLVWLVVPLALHALLPWKATRFVLLALPAMLLALGYAIACSLATLRTVVRRLASQRAGGLTGELLGYAAAGALAVPLVLLNPALLAAVRAAGASPPAEWSESRALLLAMPAAGRLPVGHANSLPALHYWGRLDFTVNEGLRERWLSSHERARHGLPDGMGYVQLPMGSPDLYTGAPVLSSPDAIRTHFASAGGVLIGVDPDRVVLEGVQAELLKVLREEATELCNGRCGRMLLFHWRLDAATSVVTLQ